MAATIKVNVKVDKELMVKCNLEPISLHKGKEDKIKFTLKPKKYEFVGFLSPQDLQHKCFDVQNIGDNAGGLSVMTVVDNFCEPKRPVLYRYQLVFQQRKQQGGTPGNLYNHDPQIKNEN